MPIFFLGNTAPIQVPSGGSVDGAVPEHTGKGEVVGEIIEQGTTVIVVPNEYSDDMLRNVVADVWANKSAAPPAWVDGSNDTAVQMVAAVLSVRERGTEGEEGHVPGHVVPVGQPEEWEQTVTRPPTPEETEQIREVQIKEAEKERTEEVTEEPAIAEATDPNAAPDEAAQQPGPDPTPPEGG